MRGGVASIQGTSGGPPTPYFSLEYYGPAAACRCMEAPVACMLTDPAETGSERCGGDSRTNVPAAATGLPNWFFGGDTRMSAFGPTPTRYLCGDQPFQPLGSPTCGSASCAPIAGGRCGYGGTYPVAGGVFPNLTPPTEDCDAAVLYACSSVSALTANLQHT